jgi:hypothetical protein
MQKATCARYPASRVTEASVHVTKANHHHGATRRVAGGALNAYKTCGHAVVESLQCSTHPLTTHDALLQCPVTRQHSATEPLLCQETQQLGAMLRMGAMWRDNWTGHSPRREDIITYS